MEIAWIQGLVLGAVQGITEFFPVSSSGHLILVPVLFGWPDQGLAFDTVLHLGTLVALFWFFRNDIRKLVQWGIQPSEDGKRARQFIAKVIVATVPTLVLAVLFGDRIETFARSSRLVAFDLAFWGMVLFAVDRWRASRVVSGVAQQDLEQVTWKQAMLVGCAQPLSLLPGTSRSGMTMTAGLAGGLPRALAARFSFFLSIPITTAAGAHGLLQTLSEPTGVSSPLALFVGFVVAMITGAWAISFLISYVSKQRFDLFVAYRLVLAGCVFVLV